MASYRLTCNNNTKNIAWKQPADIDTVAGDRLLIITIATGVLSWSTTVSGGGIDAVLVIESTTDVVSWLT